LEQAISKRCAYTQNNSHPRACNSKANTTLAQTLICTHFDENMDPQMEQLEIAVRKSCSACQDLLAEGQYSNRQWLAGPTRRCWKCNMQNKKRCSTQTNERYFQDVIDISKKPPSIAAVEESSDKPASAWASSLSSMSLDESTSSSASWDSSLDDEAQLEEWVHVADAFDIEEQILGDSGAAHFT